MGPERAQGRTGCPQSLVIKTMPRVAEITQNWQQKRGVEGGEGGGGADAGEAQRVAARGEEGDRRQPRACRRAGGGVGYGMIKGAR